MLFVIGTPVACVTQKMPRVRLSSHICAVTDTGSVEGLHCPCVLVLMSIAPELRKLNDEICGYSGVSHVHDVTDAMADTSCAAASRGTRDPIPARLMHRTKDESVLFMVPYAPFNERQVTEAQTTYDGSH